MLTDYSIWDVLLLALVPCQATAIAYLHSPKHKALLLSFPIPFTLASLAVGKPVDAVNVIGLSLFMGYSFLVYVLHARLRLPIVLSIATAALSYCGIAAWLAPVVPSDGRTFWIAAVLTLGLGLLLYVRTRHRVEPGHRSPLPVWIKFPILAGVIAALLLIKPILAGFLAMFPMVGLITAYEARHCLWTIFRQIPLMVLAILPMMMAMRVVVDRTDNIGLSLAVGWMMFLILLVVLTRHQWRAAAATQATVDRDNTL